MDLYSSEEVRLRNGVPVVLCDHPGHVASAYWWVQTGSRDEQPGEYGFAHFLEHMHFKDAAAKDRGLPSTGQMARKIESCGGDINAYTSFEQTVYHVTCAELHWEKVLSEFAVLSRPQSFLGEDFRREREVILEEIRRNDDSPDRQIFQTLFEKLFGRHAYGRPVLGFSKTLLKATPRDLERFYRRTYTPERMGFLLVGPLQGERKRRLVGVLERNHDRSTKSPKLAKENPRDLRVKNTSREPFSIRPFDVKTPTLVLGFRVPKISHADMPGLDVLSGILSSGELSRLYEALFYEKSLVTEIGGGLFGLAESGMFYIHAEFEREDQADPVLEGILGEIGRIRDKGVDDEEIERVRAHSESEKLYGTQTVDGIANRLGFLKFTVEDPSFDDRFLEKIRQVTEADLKEMVSKYLVLDRFSGVLMVPRDCSKSDQKKRSQSLNKILKQFYKVRPIPASKNLKGSQKNPKTLGFEVERKDLSCGARAVWVHRPKSQVFSLAATVLGGSRLEGKEDWGASNFLAQLWSKGTSQRSGREISQIVEGSAAELDGYSGRNLTGLELVGLKKDFLVLAPLFNEVLLQPSIPEDELEHCRRVVLDSIRGLEDHSSQLCQRLFLETLFEVHPYGRLAQGSVESAEGMAAEQIREIHRSRLDPKRLVITFSGGVEKAQKEDWLEEVDELLSRFAEERRGPSADELAVPAVAEEVELRTHRWVSRRLGREQTHVLVGGLGLRLRDSDRFPMRVLQTILGGQSGRLFIELREKKSLAYTVAPISVEGIEKGWLGAYLACAPEKEAEALKGIEQVLETLARKGPSARELSRAKEFYLGRRAMDLQGDQALTSYYSQQELYEIQPRSEGEFQKRIRGVTAKEVQEICERYYVLPHRVTSAVG